MDEKGVMPRRVLLVFLAALFGWLLSFPLFGPGLDWFTARGARTLDGVYLFLVFHALGLVAWCGSRMWRTRSPWSLATLGLTFCLAASGLSLRWPQGWPAFAAIMGLASAPAVLAWCMVFTDTVPGHLRGRTLAIPMALANGILYASTWLSISGPWPLAGLLLAIAILAVSLGIAAVPGVRGHLAKEANGPACPGAPDVAGKDGPLPAPKRSNTDQPHFPSMFSRRPTRPGLLFLPEGVALFIACIYITAGLVAETVYAPLEDFPAMAAYWGIPAYIVSVLMAGPLADSHGRRWLAHGALAAIGISLTLSASLHSFLTVFLAHILIQAGYALADLYLWITLADLSRPGEAPRYFGLGLGLNVLAVGLGAYLSPLVAGTVTDPRSLALISLFATVLALSRLQETLDRQAVTLAADTNLEPETLLPTPGATANTVSQAAAPSFLAPPGPLPDRSCPATGIWPGENVQAATRQGEDPAFTACGRGPAQVAAGGSWQVLAESNPAGTGSAAGPAAELWPVAEQPGPQTTGPGPDSHDGDQPPPKEELLRPFAGRLTCREQDVVLLVAQGLSYAEIREQLYISEGTLKTHLRNIYRKLGVRSRRELLEALSGKAPDQ